MVGNDLWKRYSIKNNEKFKTGSFPPCEANGKITVVVVK